MGGCFSTSLGAALHELGHLFDLVHSDYGNNNIINLIYEVLYLCIHKSGIMARGFEDVDVFFTVNNSSPILPSPGTVPTIKSV